MALRALRQGRSSEEVIQLAVRLGLLAILIIWCFIIVQPFIPIFAWGVVLAVALYPLYSWLSERLGGWPKLAAVILTLTCIAIVVGPATWLGIGLVEGLRTLHDQLESQRLIVPSPPAAIRDWPLVGARLYDLWTQASTNIEAALAEFAPYLKPYIKPMIAMMGGMGLGALKFLASVLLAGFLFPSGPRLVAAIRNILERLLPERSEDLVALAGKTIRTVSQGVIGIALVQSFLIGIGLKFAGIASAGLLAFVVLVLSILQIGAAPVLIPCIIWIWVTKDFTTALFMTIYLGLVGLADNVFRPMLMGRGLTTPMVVIFIGLLGGTLAHGIVGLFIGPIILAVGWELMMAWIRDDLVRKTAIPAERVPAELRRPCGEKCPRPLPEWRDTA